MSGRWRSKGVLVSDDRKPRRLSDRFILGLKTKRGESYAQVFDTVTRGLDAGAKSFYFVYRTHTAYDDDGRVVMHGTKKFSGSGTRLTCSRKGL